MHLVGLIYLNIWLLLLHNWGSLTQKLKLNLRTNAIRTLIYNARNWLTLWPPVNTRSTRRLYIFAPQDDFWNVMCIKIMAFWDVTSCWFVDVYRRFGRACRLHPRKKGSLKDADSRLLRNISTIYLTTPHHIAEFCNHFVHIKSHSPRTVTRKEY
jgi:hypothetical protein